MAEQQKKRALVTLLQANMRQALRERGHKSFWEEQQRFRDQWMAANNGTLDDEEWDSMSHLSTKQRLGKKGILLSNKNSRVSGKVSPHIRQQQQSGWMTKAGKKRSKQFRDRARA
jgi:hypothetical protein